MNNQEGRQEIASEVRQRIYEKTQLTASAGIACNKMLAKISSDMNKPNGQFYLPPDREIIVNFIQSQNIRKIPGIGKVQEKILNELGVKTCADILRLKVDLSFVYNESLNFFLRAALGMGSTYHSNTYEDQKSISLSRTFHTTEDMIVIQERLKEYCQSLSDELIEKDAECKTVSVFVKNFRFENTNKSETSKKYLQKMEDIHEIAFRLLNTIKPFEPIRLLGVRASNLEFNRSKRKSIDSYWKIQEFSSSDKKDTKETEALKNQENSMRGIRIVRAQCPNCKDWMTLSEHRLEIHIGECNSQLKRKIQQETTAKKKKLMPKGATLDRFISKT